MRGRRRNYFIKKRFQSEVILKIAMVWLIGVIFGTVVLYLKSGETLTAYYSGGNLILKKTSEIIVNNMLISAVINFFITVLFGVFVMLFISHRLAGPLYRFEKTIEEMTEGKVDFTIKLRKKDELVDLVPKFNRLLSTYNGRIGEIKKTLTELKKYCESENSKELFEKLEREINFFKTR